MSLALRVRHNWSEVMNKEFFALEPNGELVSDLYQAAKPALNYNSFNLDLVYSWWFAPGSEISIVWKNSFEENVNEVQPRYFDNFSHTLSSPQTSIFSVKVLYYIDYLTLKKTLTKS